MGVDLASYTLSPLFFLLIFGGLIGITSMLFLVRHRDRPGVRYWFIWQLAASIWAFTYAFEFAANDIESKIWWSKLSYFGIVYCPVSFLYFSLAFSSQIKLLQKKFNFLLYGISTLFILSPFTNEIHQLHWKSYSIDPVTHATIYVYGPFFWILVIFMYSLLFAGIINIFLLYFRLSGYYKNQINMLFFASLIPLAGNVIYIFHINPYPGFDWTPFSFLISGILIAIGITQFKMFELVPFARNKLIDIIPDAILLVDINGRIADLNNAMRTLIDSDEIAVIGKRVEDVFPHRESLIREIEKNKDFQVEISREIDGIMRYFDLNITLIHDREHQPGGRLLVMKDITHRMQAEEKIKLTNLQLMVEIQEKEKLIADLDAFSHTVAHDLKNMLGAIVSASNLIRTGLEDFSRGELLEINELIHQSATKTMHITSELLTLASVRQQDIQAKPVRMLPVLNDALYRLQEMIQEKNAGIKIAELWPEVLGHEAWLEEIWINYLSNAIKYGGDPPVIEVGNEILPNRKVKCWIKDNGKGLSPAEIGLLFNKFTRLEPEKAEGHGLGLSIVKRIVEKLNGEIGVESDNIDGEGACFYFILPYSGPNQEGQSETDPIPLTGKSSKKQDVTLI